MPKLLKAQQEYMVLTTTGPILISANSREEAETIALKDGHSLKRDLDSATEFICIACEDTTVDSRGWPCYQCVKSGRL